MMLAFEAYGGVSLIASYTAPISGNGDGDNSCDGTNVLNSLTAIRFSGTSITPITTATIPSESSGRAGAKAYRPINKSNSSLDLAIKELALPSNFLQNPGATKETTKPVNSRPAMPG